MCSYCTKRTERILMLLLLILAWPSADMMGQCNTGSIDLPDANNSVTNPNFLYCTSFTVDPSVTGPLVGFTLNLSHTWQGDLSIRIEACGQTLMLLTRPGGGSCGAGAPFGSPADVNGNFTFTDTGPNPDGGLALGGGSYGLSGDPCGVGTVSSFAELAAICGNEPYTLDFCIGDHAFGNTGAASSITPMFGGAPAICGCTDPAAANYNPAANIDDGSCDYPCFPPAPPTASGAQICAGEQVDLNALGCNAGTINWYTTPTGGTPFDFGPSITTPPLNATVTYYIECDDGFGCPSARTPVQVVVTQNTTINPPPIGPFCEDSPPLGLSPIQSGITGVWSGLGMSGNIFNPSTVGAGNSATLTFTPNPGQCAEPSFLEVEILSDPEPIIDGPFEICTGQTGILSVLGTFSSYAWSTGANTPSIAINAPGTYSVTVTSVPGNCSGTADFTVSEGESLAPEVDGPIALCAGQTGVLSVLGSYASYQWSTGQTTPSIGIGAPGFYSVTVTDAGGCTGEGFITIEEETLTEPFIEGPAAVCVGELPTLSVSNAFDYTTFNWSSGGTGPTTTVPGPGTYTLIATNAAGCSVEAQFVVELHPPSNPQIIGNMGFCEGESTFLEVSPNNFADYLWSTGSADPLIEVSTAGQVSVTVTDFNGCEAQAVAFVQASPSPNVSISGPAAVCEGQPAVLSVDNAGLYGSINWSTGETTPAIAVTAGGAYDVFVTDGNGCTGEAFFEVMENPLPDASIDGELIFCQGESTILSAAGFGAQYAWSTGSTSSSISVTAPGAYTLSVTDAEGCQNTETVIVEQTPIPQPSISGPTTFCAGESVELSASLGFSTYTWSNGETGESIIVDQPGTYSVTVEDFDGCSGFTTVQVQQAPQPPAFINGELAICSGESTLLTAPPGPFTYNWSTGATGQIIPVSAGGFYEVTVTNAGGCSSVADVEVIENIPPQPAILGNLSFCEDGSSQLSLDQAYASYNWSTGSTAASIMVTSLGTVSVTVTDIDGCEGVASVEVETYETPTVAISGDLAYCAGDSTLLQADTSFAAYVWSNDSTSHTLAVSTPGIYGLTVTDTEGCVGETSVEVVENEVPTASISGELAYCAGDSILLTAPAGIDQYLWSDSSSTAELTIIAPGTYALTVTNAAGCADSTAVEVVEYPLPAPVITGLLGFCEGGSTSLALSEAYTTYQWSTGSTADSLDISEAGDISVTVTNAQGCTASAEVSIITYSEPTVAISGALQYCEGESTVLTADAGFATYLWNDGSNSSSLAVDTPGTYSLTVTDASGCTGSTTVEVVENSLPTLAIGGSSSYCPGGFATLNAGGTYATYQWSDGSTTPSIQVDQAGSYSLSVTDENGCADTASIEVTEQDELSPVISGDLAFCPGFSTTLSVDSGFSVYDWSDGSTGPALSVSAPGTYSVSVADASGCTGEAAVTIQEHPAAEVAVAAPAGFCAGDSAELLASGDGLSTFAWSDGSTGPSLAVSQAGTYTVVATDTNGCRDTTSATLEMYALPNIAIAGEAAFCAGSSTLLQVDTGFAAYAWSDGSTGNELLASQPGTYSVTVTDAQGCEGEAALQVLENEVPTASISGELAYCAGESTLLNAPAGLGDYQWSDGSTGEQLSVAAPGTYGLTVTSAAGCADSTAVEVVENALPEPAITGVLGFCSEGSTSLGLSETYASYQWSTGSTAASVDISQVGSVAVTVTDAEGCTASTEVLVTTYDEPAVAINGPLQYCQGESTLLTADAGFATYAWNDGSTTSNELLADQPGTYSVTVTDASGCIGSTSVEVVENSLPQPTINGQDYFCAGESTLLAAGSGFAAYAWSTGADGQQAEINTPGSVQLTVTDGNGCQGSVVFEVAEAPLPEPVISGTTEICPEGTAQLSTQLPYEAYAWSTAQTSASISLAQAGPVSVTVTDALGCMGNDTTAISYFDTEIPEIEGELAFCPDGETQLQGEAGFAQYAWSTGSTAAALNVSQPGPYSLTVTDANGCVTENSAEVSLYAVSNPVIEGPEGFCTGSTANLLALDGFAAYQWSNGSGDSLITVGQGGIYAVTATDANGCQTENSFQLIENSLPALAIGGSSSYCPGGFAALNAGGVYTAYQWSDGSTGPSIQVSQEGTYSLSVTDENGCENTDSISVTEEDELSPVISGARAFCPGFSTTLSVDSGFTISDWSDGTSGPALSVSEPGTYSVSVADASGCIGEAAVTVEMHPEAEVAIAAPTGFCTGESATLSASGDNLNIFNWSQGSFGPNITVNEPGDYSVVATDLNGCRDTAAVFVQAFALPDFEIEGQDFFCAGESTTLTASAAFEAYVWNGEPGDQAREVGQAGLYVLEVTDANGCSSIESVQVGAIPLPQADAGQPGTLTCAVLEVDLGGMGSTTGPAFTYEWTGPGIGQPQAGQANPVVTEPGTYSLVVTDTVHQCVSAPATVVIDEQRELPTVELAEADTLNCVRESVLLDGSASSNGNGISYEWYDSDETLLATAVTQLSIEQPGLYVLRLENTSTGCVNQDSIVVVQDVAFPTAEAGSPQRLDCAIVEVPLSAAGSSQGGNMAYSWANEQQSTIAQGDTALVNAPGLYFLSVTNTVNGCISIDSVSITQDISQPVADAGEPQQIDCVNPEAQLSGAGSSQGPGFSYAWALSDTSNVLSNSLSYTAEAPGQYFLVVTNEDNHCQSLASVEVIEIAAAPSALGSALRVPTCFGDGDGSIIISGVEGGTAPYLYSFNGQPFSTQQQFTGLDGGTYTLVVQDAIGCEYEELVTLPEGNDLSVELGAAITVQAGQDWTLNAQINIPEDQIADIRWQGADSLSCYDCLQPTLLARNSGLYRIQVTDVNGCTASAQVQLFVDKQRNVFLPNIFSPNGDGNNDVFYIQAGPDAVRIASFQIYSRWGEEVFFVTGGQPNDPQVGWNGMYRGQQLNSGVFVWSAEIEFADGETVLYKGDVVLMR